MYETVLREATSPEDLARWLDGPTLVRLWPEPVLPPQVRRPWEAGVPAAFHRPPVRGVVTDRTPPIHRRPAAIGLRVGGPFGFALAGGHAIAAHGILDRPSEDVDLFADWQHQADSPTAVDEVIAAYRVDGLDVQV